MKERQGERRKKERRGKKDCCISASNLSIVSTFVAFLALLGAIVSYNNTVDIHKAAKDLKEKVSVLESRHVKSIPKAVREVRKDYDVKVILEKK